MSYKYFYIITRDGMIIETSYTEHKIVSAAKAVQDKGILTFKEEGAVINGADISKVLNEDQYENYISTVKPKEYIKNGIWRDGKENGIIRYEKWKKEEFDSVKKIENKTDNKYITYQEFINRNPQVEPLIISIYGKEKTNRMRDGENIGEEKKMVK